MTVIRLPSWREVLEGPWALRLRAGATAAWLMRGEAEAVSELDCRFVAGVARQDSASLFEEFQSVLEFPDYFGHNWDAFDECVGDLAWIDADEIALLVLETDRVLRDDRSRWSAFVSALQAGAEQLAAEERTLRVIFQARELPLESEAVLAEFGVAEIAA